MTKELKGRITSFLQMIANGGAHEDAEEYPGQTEEQSRSLLYEVRRSK